MTFVDIVLSRGVETFGSCDFDARTVCLLVEASSRRCKKRADVPTLRWNHLNCWNKIP